MIRVYSRCNGGHYFDGEACPLDGWSSPEAADLAAVARRLVASGEAVSVDALRAAGASEGALKNAIVVEFGADAAPFQAMVPAGYEVDGVGFPLPDADRRLR
jgi:hypothetical protein